MECNNVRKVKKKQVKDELDRIKQAEKKKRRLEKALATSAAIRSELEKKKQRKQEEQKRLDEEGAAIAEAVALHVLLGEDSDDDSGDVMLNKDEGLNKWDLPEMIPHHHHNNIIQGWMVSSSDTTTTGISADLIAAQAVSSLQIGEEVTPIEKYVFNLRW